MTLDRTTELLNLEADGLLTEGQRDELSALAAGNLPIERSRAELRELVRMLDEFPAVEPPANLCREVLAALPPTSAVGPPRHSWFVSFLRETLMMPRVLFYAGGAVVVLALAYFGGDFMRPVTEVGSTDGLTGTLTPRTTVAADRSTSIDLDRAGLRGSIRLARTSDGLQLHVDVLTEGPLELVLTYDPQTLRVLGPAAATAGRLSAPVPAGQAYVHDFLWTEAGKNVEASIHFEFRDTENTWQHGSLTLAPDGGLSP